MTIGIGIIGCGMVAEQYHLPGFADCKGARVVALADVVKERAEKVSKAFGIEEVYTDWREMIKRRNIDAVSVCAPNFLHAEMVIAFAQAKKHILVEKPMAISLKDADSMIEAAEKNGVYLMVEQIQRFNPAHRIAKQIIDSGTVGRINTINGRIAHGGPELWSPTGSQWFLKKKEALGGSMIDIGIHEIDLIRWLVGKRVVGVSAFMGTFEKQGEVDDNGVCIFKFEDGTFGRVESSWTAKYKPFEMNTMVYGEKAELAIFVNADASENEIIVNLKEPKGKFRPDIPKEDWLKKPFHYFVECIQKRVKPFVSGEEGRDSLEVILAAYQANDSGRVIKLPVEESEGKITTICSSR